MRTFDFTPYRRSMIGFDRLFDHLERTAQQQPDAYPPFDIERLGDDTFRIAVAVAGFAAAEVDVTAHNNVLTIKGEKPVETGQEQRQYLHRGIAARAFERRFELADFIQVKSAELKDGLLVVDLVREVPESAKPRKIAVGGQTAQPQTLDAQPQAPAANQIGDERAAA